MAGESIYFLGIGGTLMGSLAQLAAELGYQVSGSDTAVYPPMSDQLAAANIKVFEGFDASQLEPLAEEEADAVRWLLNPSPALVAFQESELDVAIHGIDDELEKGTVHP